MQGHTISQNDVIVATKDSRIEGISGGTSKQLYTEVKVHDISVPFRRASMPVMDLSGWIILSGILGDYMVARRPKYCKISGNDHVGGGSRLGLLS